MKILIFKCFLLLSLGLLNAQIIDYPYVESFETGQEGWTSFGTINSWELGLPDGVVINSAASGTAAWVTNLDGNYANFEDGYVQSPIFDLSVLAQPSVQLKVWWNTEFSWDGTVLQSSIDSGASWQNVGNFGDPNNWYNDDTIGGNPGGNGIPGSQLEGWTGRESTDNGSNGWVTASHDLSSLIGESSVIFRIAFGSDGSEVDEGFAFDNFKIYSSDCYAGEDNNLFSCVGSSSLPLDLNDLLSEGAASGGFWQSLGGLDVDFDDNVDLSSVEESDLYDFLYTVIGANNCQDTALIQLNLQVIPDSGEDTTTTLCSAGEEYLFDFLDPSATYSGIWESLSDPAIPLIQGEIVDFSVAGIGSYDFTYTVTSANCGGPETATITIIVESLSAGQNGTLDVCDTFTEADLFDALEGNSGVGGTWSPPINGAGIYTYTQAATTNCVETFATIEVSEIVQLSAGIDSVIESCSDVTLDDLLLELGGDEGGVWSPETYSGAGFYTYTHAATACTVESTATVDFSFFPVPDAGESGTVFPTGFGSANLNDLRNTLPPTNLERRRVDEGVWVQVDNGSPDVLTSEDGEVDFPNTGAGAAQVYEFEYIVEGDCGDAVATLIVEIYGDDTAGIDGVLIICPGGSFSNSHLFSELGGNPSIRGYWVEPITGPGVYTYIALDNSGFDADQAIVTVIEEVFKSAGQNGVLDICEGETALEADLFNALSGNPDIDGTWAEISTGVYQYSHAATTCFPSVSATVIITEEIQRSAGLNGALDICEGETPLEVDLFNALLGSPDNDGTWESISAGIYQYSHAATSCFPLVSATVTVIEEVQKSAGENGTLDICEGEIPLELDLFNALQGSPNSDGTWEEISTGIYKYSHASTSCYPEISSTVTITEETQLSAGENGIIEIEEGTVVTETQLFEALQGSPDLDGIWTPELAGADTYDYTHAATNVCPESTASVVVTETLSVDDEELNSISIYPNPANEIIKIKNSHSVVIESLEVFTIRGQLVISATDNFDEINISQLEAAIYFLKIRSATGQKTVRLIKE